MVGGNHQNIQPVVFCSYFYSRVLFRSKLAGRHDAGTNPPFKPGSNLNFGAGEKYIVLIIDDGNPTRHTYGLGPIKGFLILATQLHPRRCHYL